MHQHIVLHAIEEFRQVHVDAPAIAGLNVRLNEMDRFMSGAVGPKAEARFGKLRIEDRRQD
ncbi:hypothetical protein CA13_73950 [Planctomycetes bacterium CA13]|uniref:Uncharacterized protein n=1 Tax=Novipirellula herctigrandis TaxID=2527986 RepID=A0A5C5YIM9_9BACT|nr:hypothetical protein CA13_73950 [Planctomycetes bacterium CA13]